MEALKNVEGLKKENLMFFRVCFVIVFFSAPFFASANPEVESCKKSIFSAVDTIQSISNTVPQKAFGRFTQNGKWTSLVFAVTKLGGGNPKAGAKIMFSSAKKVLDKNKSKILKAAKSCIGKCDVIRTLEDKCDEVQDLSRLLNGLNINTGFEIAKIISNYGGTDGVKKSVSKEVSDFYKDRN